MPALTDDVMSDCLKRVHVPTRLVWHINMAPISLFGAPIWLPLSHVKMLYAHFDHQSNYNCDSF